ncbi:MAG: hypothetical protein NTX50_06080 [Candidatus Sumerlaeota bacterium]|nr:hypothetical protein [Candidatus Sumerlaeota bacterium]
MAPLTPKQIKHVDSICQNLHEFLRLRAQEIARIKPEYEVTIKGLIWRKMLAVRRSLTESLPYGTEMYVTAQILVEDDEQKKRPLLDERDERSLFFKIVTVDDADQAPDKRQHIYDLHSAFSRIDPQLGTFAQLLIYWAWWDFIDSIDMYVFDQAAQNFELMKSTALNEKIIQFYRARMKLPPNAPPIQRADILNHELSVCQKLVERWAERHEREQPYRALLVYLPPQKEMNVEDALILDVAKHLTAIERIKAQQELDAPMRAFYSELIKKPAQDLTSAEVIEYEAGLALTLRSKLRAYHGGVLSADEPVDHKARVYEGLKQRLEKMRASLPKQ